MCAIYVLTAEEELIRANTLIELGLAIMQQHKKNLSHFCAGPFGWCLSWQRALCGGPGVVGSRAPRLCVCSGCSW